MTLAGRGEGRQGPRCSRQGRAGKGLPVCPRGGRERSRFSAPRGPSPGLQSHGREELGVASDMAQKQPASLAVNTAVVIFPFVARMGHDQRSSEPPAPPSLGEAAPGRRRGRRRG